MIRTPECTYQVNPVHHPCFTTAARPKCHTPECTFSTSPLDRPKFFALPNAPSPPLRLYCHSILLMRCVPQFIIGRFEGGSGRVLACEAGLPGRLEAAGYPASIVVSVSISSPVMFAAATTVATASVLMRSGVSLPLSDRPCGRGGLPPWYPGRSVRR